MNLDTDSAIRNRKTTKVLAAEVFPCTNRSQQIAEMLDLAGMAPFHRACDEQHRGLEAKGLNGIEPWRFHVLDAHGCRDLRSQLPSENVGKIPAMLAAADALILATWLPNPMSADFQTKISNPDDEPGKFQDGDDASFTKWPFEPTLANMEHIAAASAAIQNLLLAATARGISNYWSSGGILRSSTLFEKLGIPAGQILLGALFLFPQEVSDAEVVGSKLRDRRSSSNHWVRTIELSN